MDASGPPRRRIAGIVFEVLRDGTWLTRERLRGWSVILIAAQLGGIAYLASGPGIFDRAGRPLGTDFAMFWTASKMLRTAPASALYSPEFYAAPQRMLGVRPQDLFPFFVYPPSALLLLYPLAFLPYLASFATWVTAGIALYAATALRIVGRSSTALLASMAFPVLFIVVGHGHSSFISAALLGWGLHLLPSRPWFAGALLGVLIFKPHLWVLIPVALAAGREWKGLLAATSSAALSTVAALPAFGTSVWGAFLAAAPQARQQLERGLVDYYKLQSVYAQVRMLGGTTAAAYAAQAIVTVTVLAVVVHAWARYEHGTRAVLLVIGMLLATPYVLDYDLFALSIAGVFAVSRGRWVRWEITLAVVTAFAPLIARPLAALTHVSVTPIVLCALLLLQVSAVSSRSLPGVTDATGGWSLR